MYIYRQPFNHYCFLHSRRTSEQKFDVKLQIDMRDCDSPSLYGLPLTAPIIRSYWARTSVDLSSLNASSSCYSMTAIPAIVFPFYHMGSEGHSPPKSRSHSSPTHPYETWQGRGLSAVEIEKLHLIIDACEGPGDHETLIALATSRNGLIDDEVRQIACMAMMSSPYVSWLTLHSGPLLLGYNGRQSTTCISRSSWRDLPTHRDEGQVELDVNRSFVYYPKSTQTLNITYAASSNH